MHNKSPTWIAQELRERGWSAREFARRVGKSYSHVARIVHVEQRPTLKMRRDIGRALDLTQLQVAVRSGLLDLPPDDLIYKVAKVLKPLSLTERRKVLDYARSKYRFKLKQMLDSRLSESELCDIIFYLPGVNYEDLPGASKVDKTRELIDYLERRDRIQELLDKIRELRPDIPL